LAEAISACQIVALARQHDLPPRSRDGHFDRVPSLNRLGW